MKLKYKKRLVIYLAITLGIGSYLAYEHPYRNNYTINTLIENGPFGTYKHGNIYIGTRDYLTKVVCHVKPGDVLIEQGYKVDDGYYDPNYKIYSSYLITDKDDRNDILNVLYIYNQYHAWKLDRSIESMRIEWSVHNFLYYLGIERNRTSEVDLNNGDESIYSNPIFKSFIK